MSSELQLLIWNLITLTDEVNEKGEHVPRTSFKKDYFRGVISIKNKLLGNLEYGFIPENKEPKDVLLSDVEWSKEKKLEGKKSITDRFAPKDMELEKNEKKALKYLYEDREELPNNISIETLDELDKILN